MFAPLCSGSAKSSHSREELTGLGWLLHEVLLLGKKQEDEGDPLTHEDILAHEAVSSSSLWSHENE